MTDPTHDRIEPLGYAPALDGVRALAVLAVLLFHSDASFASGGFLGVSVFFTVSGFLVASLLLDEHARSGRIDLRAFAGRRARRLIPAAWAGVALVAAGVPFWNAGQLERLRGDMLAALANLTNWRAASSSTSYQDLFDSSPSPLAHFWSLAIEMQFYVALPIIAVATLRIGGHRLFAATVALLSVASLAATVATDDFDLVYNGTHTRAAELLLGVLLAVAAFHARQRGLAQHAAGATAVGLGGLIGLAALVVTTSTSSAWLLEGGLLAVAVLSCGVVVAATRTGPVERALSQPALVEVGKLSYGIYLFHWPLFLVLTPDRLGIDGVALFAVRLAATAVLTVASYRLLETPIRRNRRLTTPRATALVAAAAATTLVVAAVVAPVDPVDDTTELLATGDTGLVRFDTVDDRIAHSPTVPSAEELHELARNPSPAPATTDPPPAPLRILVVGGDTTALAVVAAFGASSVTRPVDVIDATRPDCAFATAVEISVDDRIADVSACAPTDEVVAAALGDSGAPDVVVIAAGPLDNGTLRRADDVGFPTDAMLDAVAERSAVTHRTVDALVAPFDEANVPVVMSWWGDAGLLDLELGRIAARRDSVAGFARDADQLTRLLERATAADPAPSETRVMVIGDSTSLVLARALHDADERLDVLWAGDNGCPVVRATTIHAGTEGQPKPLDCPDLTEKLPPLIAEFRPQVVIVMPGTIALANLTFVGDDRAHVPGTPDWVEYHDREFAALLGAMTPAGGNPRPSVLVADSPAVEPGPFSTSEMVSPDRVRAVNDQVERWASAHDGVTVFEYTHALERYEAEFGSIRPDNVHPAALELTVIARDAYVQPVLDAAAGDR